MNLKFYQLNNSCCIKVIYTIENCLHFFLCYLQLGSEQHTFWVKTVVAQSDFSLFKCFYNGTYLLIIKNNLC